MAPVVTYSIRRHSMALRLAHIVLIALSVLSGLQWPVYVAASGDDEGNGKRFEIGHTTFSITGTGTLGEPRPIDVEVWYPADKRSWRESSASEYSSRLQGVTLVPSKWDPLAWSVVSDVARENADFATGPFPVVILSPGSTADPIDYHLTAETVAAAGYVVAGIWHTGDSQDDVRVTFINTTNGSKALDCLDGGSAPCVDALGKNLADRARDLSTLLDTLPLAFPGKLDMSRVLGLGHSRGTLTMLGAGGGSTVLNFPPEPRVRAIIGFAIGTAAATANINLAAVSIPTVLVAGDLDGLSPKTLSESAFNTIASSDKVFVVIANSFHRHFANGFCAQLQSAGGIALGNSRAILDLHTASRILIGGINGSGGDVCNFDYFTTPIDIRPVVSTLTGFDVTSTNVPRTGIDTLEVNRLMTKLSLAFFGSVLHSLKHADCNAESCTNVRFKNPLSEDCLLSEPNIVRAVVTTDDPVLLCER